VIDGSDFIRNKHKQKKYKFYCDECGKDRGYLFKSARGGKKTGALCVQCKNGKKVKDFCKYCNDSFDLNTNHWYFESSSGYYRCSIAMYKKNIKWKRDNPEKYKEKQKRSRNKYRESLQGRLRTNMSSKISSKLSKSVKCSNIKYLDWTVSELIVHLESQFQPGMTWENYGKDGWHVDHIVPDSWFSYSSPEDEGFKKSWSLSNLQPMWAKENLSKNNRFAGGGLSLS
jgi:hypothetical protein